MKNVVNNEVDKFKEGLKKRNSKDVQQLTKITSSESIKTAIFLAYNDTKRTLKGIGKVGNAQIRDEVLKKLIDKLAEYFKNNAPIDEGAFDKAHNELCSIWTEAFPSSPLGTIGKAQKIVNMSFKYLYCCEDKDTYSDYFKYCHMPLDSFTLEWFKRSLKKTQKLTVNKIASWSTLENNSGEDAFTGNDGKKYYTYDFYVKNIRSYISDKKYGISPLELEFVVWPEIQDHLSAEAFLFALNPDYTNTDKKKIRARKVKEKLKEISNILISKGY